jgi:hypothetical protein
MRVSKVRFAEEVPCGVCAAPLALTAYVDGRVDGWCAECQRPAGIILPVGSSPSRTEDVARRAWARLEAGD